MATIDVKNAAGTTVTIPAPNSNGQATAANSSPVVIASDQSAVPVSLTAQPLPTGAATEATVAAIATYVDTLEALTSAMSAKLPATLGQKTAANSLAVTLASDQSALPITSTPANNTALLLSAAASTNSTSVKTAAGTLRGIQGYNAKASPVFLKLYDKASAPTVGTDTPVKTIYLPATSAFAFDFNRNFTLGIGFGLTGAAANGDTTALVAGDIVCLNVDYL